MSVAILTLLSAVSFNGSVYHCQVDEQWIYVQRPCHLVVQATAPDARAVADDVANWPATAKTQQIRRQIAEQMRRSGDVVDAWHRQREQCEVNDARLLGDDIGIARSLRNYQSLGQHCANKFRQLITQERSALKRRLRAIRSADPALSQVKLQ